MHGNENALSPKTVRSGVCVVFAWYGGLFFVEFCRRYFIHGSVRDGHYCPVFAFRVNGSVVWGTLSGRLVVRYSRVKLDFLFVGRDESGRTGDNG